MFRQLFHWPIGAVNLASRRLQRLLQTSGRDSLDDSLLDWSLEYLEERTLLAGEVTFSTSGNNLTVIGSPESDMISVDCLAAGIFVNGINTGIAAGSLNNLTIKSKGGSDQVTVQGGDSGLDRLQIGGNLKIITAAGSDDIVIAHTNVAGKTVVKTGGDSDSVTTFDAVYQGAVNIATSSGSDTVAVAANSPSPLGLVIVPFLDVSFLSSVKLKLGADDDFLNLGMIDTPTGVAGSASPFGDITFADSVSANGGADFDQLTVAGILIDPESIPPELGVSVTNFEFAILG